MKPILKWAGGKRHIASQLLDMFPPDWNQGRYYEPFLGGAAVFLHVNPDSATLSDLNPRLINFYKHIQTKPRQLYREIFSISQMYNSLKSEKKREALFYQLREEFNLEKNSSLKSSSLIYILNKLCFNGLYRENLKGEFNVPFGRKKLIPILEENMLLELHLKLQKVELRNENFDLVLESAIKGDFVYFDPPYIPLTATSSFTSYSASGFGDEEQVSLANLMLTLKESGVRSMCSNSDTLRTKQIFKGLRIQSIDAPRMVSAKGASRGSISELVITNY